jgi:glyoxylase-like metal-dependent hydrolase (beta-lactamase superfamily II)
MPRSGVSQDGRMITSLLFAAAIGTAVAPDVTLIPGGFIPGQQPDGNSIVFRAPKGLVVVDTGRHAEHTQAILDFAAQEHQPIAAVVNTHWHLDHIGGNPRIRAAFPGVKIYATSALDEARKGFLANYRKQLVEMIDTGTEPEEQKAAFRKDIALIDAGDALAPDVVITTEGKRSIAGREFDVRLEHGATAGDIWLLDRKSKVIAAGDLITLPGPFLDTACPAAWKSALDHLAAADFSVVVPGHGAPMQRADLERYRSAFTNLVSCAGSDKSKQDCVAGWTSDAASFLKDDDPKFVRGLMGYYVDVLRKPPSSARCP